MANEREHSDKNCEQPRFIDVAGEYEICRFDNGAWSLRDKLPDGDRAHVRYLSPFEQGLVEGALRSLSPSSTSLTRDEIGVLEAALLNGMNPAGKLMIATGWNVILGKLHAMKSLLLSATRQLPPCPKCGETDVQAAGPDWTDTGVKAEITCPRCEHAWTADFQIACTASATAFTEERLRLIARKHAHDACNPINALDPASVQEEFRCQEIIFYALKEAAASDTARLDWLERVKDAHFEPLNHHAKAISKVKLFTVETQSVVGNTAREAIDLAMAREQFDIKGERHG